MRAIAEADVWMPLCWRGVAIFPDGLGPALADAWPPPSRAPVRENEPGDLLRKLSEIVLTEAQGIWALMHEERTPSGRTPAGGTATASDSADRGPRRRDAVSYTLNPLIPCASLLLVDRWVTNVADLTPALDAIAMANTNVDLLEPHIAAFIGARSDRVLDHEVKSLSGNVDLLIAPGGAAAAGRAAEPLSHRAIERSDLAGSSRGRHP